MAVSIVCPIQSSFNRESSAFPEKSIQARFGLSTCKTLHMSLSFAPFFFDPGIFGGHVPRNFMPTTTNGGTHLAVNLATVSASRSS